METANGLASYLGALGIGGAVGAALPIIFFRTFIPAYLQEKAKNLATREDVSKITKEIEGVKIQYSLLLQRDSKIHEKQLEHLSKIFKDLSDVLEYSKLITKSAIFVNEDPSVYPQKLSDSFMKAYDEFLVGQLFLPADLADNIKRFFELTDRGQRYYNMAKSQDMPDGMSRVEHWNKAATIAHSELPELLGRVEMQSRAIIHKHLPT